MNYLLIVLSIFSFSSFVLLIVLLLKNKKTSFEMPEKELYRLKEEIRASVLGEFDRNYGLLDSSLQKNLNQTMRINEQIMQSMDAINKANRDSFELLLRQQRSLNKEEQETLEALKLVMMDALDRIRKANSEAFVDMANKSEKLSNQVHLDMDLIRKENNQKLEQIQAVVDEKLQKTLDERISKSFKEVTENLNKLYESLGALNTLTGDVQNITKIFSNVKSRGIWGEVQAESILSDILTTDQYVKDYSPRNNREKVEFAIKLPGKNGMGEVYLPIDSKFPVSDYMNYKAAVDNHDDTVMVSALKCVKERVLAEAKDIQKKYIVTPETTDFGILFVPAESIYIELLRIPDFADRLQNEQRVILSGPNNFAALLNSLRLGFKTLQIERYTSQIWHGFETLKKYFADLSKAIDDSKKAVDKASESLEGASKKKERLTSVIVQMESSAEKTTLLTSEDIEEVAFSSIKQEDE